MDIHLENASGLQVTRRNCACVSTGEDDAEIFLPILWTANLQEDKPELGLDEISDLYEGFRRRQVPFRRLLVHVRRHHLAIPGVLGF